MSTAESEKDRSGDTTAKASTGGTEGAEVERLPQNLNTLEMSNPHDDDDDDDALYSLFNDSEEEIVGEVEEEEEEDRNEDSTEDPAIPTLNETDGIQELILTVDSANAHLLFEEHLAAARGGSTHP